MTTAWAAVVSLVVLGAAGAVPAWTLVGVRWHVLPLAPLVGAVLAAVAGACTLAVAGTIVPWFVGLAVATTLVALAVGRRLPRHDRRPRRSEPESVRRAGWAGALLVLASAAWSLRPLRVPSVGWDARAIWLLRASWFAGGHGFLRAAFGDTADLVAHASYPPLVSSAVAVSWEVTGVHTYRLGVVVIALLNACAAAALGWALVEAGLEAARRVDAGRRRALALGVGVAAGPLLVLAAFGVAGPFATNGYADPLWSFAAAGAIAYGLLLPFEARHVATAAILLAVAGLTKQEGVATAMVLTVLVVLRSLAHYGRAGAKQRAAVWWCVAAGLAGLALLGAWPVLSRLLHAPRDVNTSGPRVGTYWHRADLTVHWMAPHLHVLLFAVPIAAIGALFFRAERRATGLGNDGWSWAGLAAGLAVVGGAYVTGPGNTAFWLLTSVHRTTMFPAITAWLIVGGWVVAATGTPVRTPPGISPGTVSVPVAAGTAAEPAIRSGPL
jgi:hypothetical protein